MTQTTLYSVTTVSQRGRHATQGPRHAVAGIALSGSRYTTACGRIVHGWTGELAAFPVTCKTCAKAGAK